MQRSREYRLDKIDSIRQKRQWYWGRGISGYGVQEPLTGRLLAIACQTPKPCSRACCGNIRRWTGEPTIQERRTNTWTLNAE